jgi:hypothetical protein
VLKSIAVLGILVVATLGASAPLAAQARSAVSSAELESAVLTAAPATNRAAVQSFLLNDRVTQAASRMGFRTADLAARVSTLDEATLSQVAGRVHAANLDLAGGNDTVVISTTAIIIALLIIIILLVA